MKLYHYRSIENAILELKNGTFHFSTREELNDPLEGYLKKIGRASCRERV